MTNNIPSENIAGIYLDEKRDEQYIFTRDLLVNQLQRECPNIQKWFDTTFLEEFQNLSSALSEVLPNQFGGYRKAIECIMNY